MLISVLIALFLCKKRKRERYVMKKVPPDDLELKVPLNYAASPPPSQKPYDHIARLDEFSMISVTLGRKFCRNFVSILDKSKMVNLELKHEVLKDLWRYTRLFRHGPDLDVYPLDF